MKFHITFDDGRVIPDYECATVQVDRTDDLLLGAGARGIDRLFIQAKPIIPGYDLQECVGGTWIATRRRPEPPGWSDELYRDRYPSPHNRYPGD